MNSMKTFLMAGVASVVMAAAAQAADLPTKKAPPAPAPAANCYASFSSWLDSTAADCPLSGLGVTLYGTVDVGVGYATNGSTFNPVYPNGVNELISKMSAGSGWQLLPNGLSQSNIGVKLKEQVVPGWFLVGDVNAGFDPYSLQFANGPESVVQNNLTKLQYQNANGDSSRSTSWDNSRAYIGVSSPVYGTLTFGRQYAFDNDNSVAYDAMGGAYAFSLIGTSGGAFAGNGFTETARLNDSVKYLFNYNGVRVGAMTQLGGWDQGNASQRAYQFDLGGDFMGVSFDATYVHDVDAVKLGGFSGAAIPAGDPANTLKATVANIDAGTLAAKYKWNALTVYGGYMYSLLQNPSDSFGATASANGWYVNGLNGGYPAIIQKYAFPNNEILQTAWLGAKYAVRSDIDVAASYYHEWQNNYTAAGTYCGANTTAPAPGYAPHGAANAACAGTTDVLGLMIDYRPVKRLDVYAGVMYSVVGGGMANGYLATTNVEPSAGLRFSF